MRPIRIKVKQYVKVIGGLTGRVKDCDHKGNCELKLWSEDGRYIGVWECSLDDIEILMPSP